MRIYRIAQSQFFHGSYQKLPNGTILVPRKSEYEKIWGNNPFYFKLELYRPSNKLASKNSVFMCDNVNDIDLAGGATNYIYNVKPIGNIEKHDVNWASEIDIALDDERGEEEIKKIAYNYWEGIPHFNESVWEYVAPSAEIIKLVDGDDV
jgi:hypothetical protein